MTDEIPDEEIDTSDIPPLDDAFFAAAQWWMPNKKPAVSLDNGDDLSGLKIQATEPPPEE